MRKYVIYKTINIVNNKYYIGFHSTYNINDDYLGSGKLLLQAIKKYGRENFRKEILYEFDDKTLALKKEKSIVTGKVVNDKSCYNVKKGGEGGWDFINKKLKNDSNYRKKRYKKVSDKIKKAHSEGRLSGWSVTMKGKEVWNKNKKLNESHKNKISVNNGSNLKIDEILKRKKDYKNMIKNRGWVKQLSEKWNVSHTQVRRFIKKHIDIG
jgi:hypothetical protein